jgi:phage N-6-adenine-methyltransferase
MTKQDYGTPRELIRAVELRFGPIVHDIAASAHNHKHSSYWTEADDALSKDWAVEFPQGNLWLNPPFKHIAPWAEKCSLECFGRDGLILMLTPASIGAAWYAKWAYPYARTIPLLGRLTFEGMPPNPKTGKIDPYPKDCMLTVFDSGNPPHVHAPWDWRATLKAAA